MKELITQSTKQGKRAGFVEGVRAPHDFIIAGMIRATLRKMGDGGVFPKMSEVLRACKIPQIIGDYSDSHGACALGALGIATDSMKDGKPIFDKMLDFFHVHAGEMNASAGGCPHCDKQCLTVWGMIPHLNDVHQQSFAQIADWLETKGL